MQRECQILFGGPTRFSCHAPQLFSLVFNNSKAPSTHWYYIARLAENGDHAVTPQKLFFMWTSRLILSCLWSVGEWDLAVIPKRFNFCSSVPLLKKILNVRMREGHSVGKLNSRENLRTISFSFKLCSSKLTSNAATAFEKKRVELCMWLPVSERADQTANHQED